MLIGKPGQATTSICTADAHSIEIRGRDLASDLMGNLTFTEFFYFLVTGREPTENQRYFLDLLLVAIAEHGLTPTAQTARMTYDAAPDSLQSAVAAGILGCGTVVLGTAELCGRFLVEAQQKTAGAKDAGAALKQAAADIRSQGAKMPGFGHPLHHPVDPRAERVIALANERGVSGDYMSIIQKLPPVVADVWGKPMPMNVSMPIAGVLLDLSFPVAMIKAIPLLARTAGLLGHLAEEQDSQIGFLMAYHADAAIKYERS